MTCAVIAQGRSCNRKKRLKIRVQQGIQACPHDRQFVVAVNPGPAMPRQMLDDRDHAFGQQSVRDGGREFPDHRRITGKGPIADDVVRTRCGYVGNGSAIDRDP